MKNKFLLVVLAILLSAGAFAQDLSYNKWTIEASGGLVRPSRNFSPGFAPERWAGLFNADFGIRYMFNEFFGLKLSFDYDSYAEGENSLAWETTYYNLGLEGVANLGRIFKFQDWTRTFNVLAHAGFGVGMFDFDRFPNVDDRVGNVMGGLTLQAKLSPRVALFLDGGARVNFKQNHAFDGGLGNGTLPFVYTSTLGLSVALGKNSSHADWYLRDEASLESVYSKINMLESDLKANSNKDNQLSSRVDGLERKVNDVDRKLTNHLDNHPSGGGTDANAVIAKLINDGYVNIFFDYNQTKPIASSTDAVKALHSYLTKNPGASVKLVGYADERGTEAYNKTLSKKRADAVAKMLTDAGISSSRITTDGGGKDLSIKPGTPTSYQLARRVSFELR